MSCFSRTYSLDEKKIQCHGTIAKKPRNLGTFFFRENNLQVENVFGNCFFFGKEIVFFLVNIVCQH